MLIRSKIQLTIATFLSKETIFHRNRLEESVIFHVGRADLVFDFIKKQMVANFDFRIPEKFWQGFPTNSNFVSKFEFRLQDFAEARARLLPRNRARACFREIARAR